MGASAIIFQDLVDPEILEAMASLEALSLATDLDCQRIVVATDCMATITHLKGEYNGPSAVMIQDIKQRMQAFFMSVDYVHEKREMNLEAHKLSKAAITLPFGRHIWLSILHDIICILELIFI